MVCRSEAQLGAEREVNQRLKGEGALLRNQHADMKLQLDAARAEVAALAAKTAALQEVRALPCHVECCKLKGCAGGFSTHARLGHIAAELTLVA